ncbi:MAG: hypothetical protein Q9160_003152 [Pyrenula sp. 1 TL-2023]
MAHCTQTFPLALNLMLLPCLHETQNDITSNHLIAAQDIPPIYPTSSVKLDELLQQCRKHYFVPFGVGENYRKLIFNRKSGHQHLTTGEGISITTTSDEKIKLEPLPPLPSFKKKPTVRRILKLMAQTNDFSNLLPLMEGMVVAGSPLTNGELQEVARRANEAGKLDEILTYVGMVDRTAASLRNRAFAKEIFLGLHMAGQRSNWAGEGVVKALKQAENMAHKMEHERPHREDPQPRSGIVPLRVSPEIAGVGLELAVAQAVNDYGGEDRDAKVTNYARRVLALWDNGTYISVRDDTQKGTLTTPETQAERPETGAVTPDSTTAQSSESQDKATSVSTEAPGRGNLYSRADALLYWLPLYNGLRLAEKVNKGLDSELKARLAERLAELDSIVRDELTKTRAAADGRERRELRLHKEIGVA